MRSVCRYGVVSGVIILLLALLASSAFAHHPTPTHFKLKVVNHTDHAVWVECAGQVSHKLGHQPHGSHIFRFKSFRESFAVTCAAWNSHGKVVGKLSRTLGHHGHGTSWDIGE